ncbi:MAG TPA: hypothetical protein VGE40_11275 [Bacilli bacterium]
MGYQDSARFGKRSEFIVIAELLRLGFDVYLTLVDDKAIDCVIRLNNQQYVDVQIKARNQDGINWNKFGPLSIEPRQNYIYIFYTEFNKIYWVIPSIELVTLCSDGKTGKHQGKMALRLPRIDIGDKAEQYKRYRNNFSLIEELVGKGVIDSDISTI